MGRFDCKELHCEKIRRVVILNSNVILTVTRLGTGGNAARLGQN
jgi:hypothetical protein